MEGMESRGWLVVVVALLAAQTRLLHADAVDCTLPLPLHCDKAAAQGASNDCACTAPTDPPIEVSHEVKIQATLLRLESIQISCQNPRAAFIRAFADSYKVYGLNTSAKSAPDRMESAEVWLGSKRDNDPAPILSAAEVQARLSGRGWGTAAAAADGAAELTACGRAKVKPGDCILCQRQAPLPKRWLPPSVASNCGKGNESLRELVLENPSGRVCGRSVAAALKQGESAAQGSGWGVGAQLSQITARLIHAFEPDYSLVCVAYPKPGEKGSPIRLYLAKPTSEVEKGPPFVAEEDALRRLALHGGIYVTGIDGTYRSISEMAPNSALLQALPPPLSLLLLSLLPLLAFARL